MSSIEAMLKENQETLTQLIVEQNLRNFEPSIELYKTVYRNILSLVNMGDSQPDTPNLLYNNYIPLSKTELQRVLHEERMQENCTGDFYSLMIEENYKRSKQNTQKKSRAECRWKPEEEMKFLEALEKFGEKNLNAIAEYIGTRNKTQVRSHLQKYNIKRSKSERPEEFKEPTRFP